MSCEDSQNQYFEKKWPSLIPIIIGFLGGLIMIGIPLVVMHFLQDLFWKPACQYNKLFCGNFDVVQIFVITVIGSLYIAIIIFRCFGQRIRMINEAIKAGMLSGVSTGFILFVLFLIFQSTLPIHWEMEWGIIVILSTLCQIIGIISLLISENHSIIPHENTSLRPSNTFIICSFIVVILVFFLIIILPILNPYADFRLGVIPYSPPEKCCGEKPDILTINRLGVDSVSITQQSQFQIVKDFRNYPWMPSVVISPSYRYFVDGKELTNMSIIQRQELEDIVDPADGLTYHYGSKVVIVGPDLVVNETQLCRVLVVEMCYGEEPVIVIDQVV